MTINPWASRLIKTKDQKVIKGAKRKWEDIRYVFVPVNQDNAHWKLLIVDRKEKNIFFLDSINAMRDGEDKRFLFLLIQ